MWCVVCGRESNGRFCSDLCFRASIDYHNAESVAADAAYSRRGIYVYNRSFLRGGRPARKIKRHKLDRLSAKMSLQQVGDYCADAAPGTRKTVQPMGH